MKHPNPETLALHAGGDLGAMAGWRTRRHLARCAECREEVARFEQFRQLLPSLDDSQDVHWGRLAAEMKANIRLGLAAGECVRTEDPAGAGPIWSFARVGVALASVAALLAMGVVLDRPAPTVARETGVVVQATADGVQVREGGQSMGLMHSGTSRDAVTYQVGAQGSVEARYVDSETGYVTVNKVDVE
jgi:anti-sigma factor RsiW